jgi:FAD:protein FMN transferase
VSADLFDVLVQSRKMHERSEGAFDVTIAPVGRLWRRARRERKLPDPFKLAEARKLVGSDRMLLDPAGRTVALRTPGMKLDVGGIAKGYAAQAALLVLQKAGVSRSLVGGAGDIVVGEAPPDTPGWTIAIAPLEPGKPGAALPPMLLRNAAVSTAGDSERFVIIDGRRYSHIINPKTGQAVEDRASVTVVAPDGGTADALETTVYILGPERGLKLVEETPGAAAIYVRSTPEGITTFESSRFKLIPKKKESKVPSKSRDLGPGTRSQ